MSIISDALLKNQPHFSLAGALRQAELIESNPEANPALRRWKQSDATASGGAASAIVWFDAPPALRGAVNRRRWLLSLGGLAATTLAVAGMTTFWPVTPTALHVEEGTAPLPQQVVEVAAATSAPDVVVAAATDASKDLPDQASTEAGGEVAHLTPIVSTSSMPPVITQLQPIVKPEATNGGMPVTTVANAATAARTTADSTAPIFSEPVRSPIIADTAALPGASSLIPIATMPQFTKVANASPNSPRDKAPAKDASGGEVIYEAQPLAPMPTRVAGGTTAPGGSTTAKRSGDIRSASALPT